MSAREALEAIRAEAERARRALACGEATNGRTSLRRIEEIADDACRSLDRFEEKERLVRREGWGG